MAIANLIVAVRTAGANQLRNLSTGFRQASRAGRQAAAQMRGDFDRAVVTLNRANAEVARLRREMNRAPSQETARALHLAALAARQAANQVDNLADQMRQANRAANSLVGRMAAVAAAAATIGSDMGGRSQMFAGLIAGLVALAPAIGAALSAAIVAGLGGIGLGAAIFAAFKDEDIKAVWKDVFAGIGSDIKNFARQLGPALTQSANMFRLAWGRAADYVRSLFGDLGSAIVPLTAGLIAMAREAGPGLRQAFAMAVPVLKELAALMPVLGRGLSSFFSSVSSGDAAMKGIRLIVLSLAGSLMILGKTIQFLGAWFSFWATVAEKVYSTLGKIPGLGAPFKFLGDALKGINEPVGALDKNLRIMSGTQLAVAQASRDAATAMQKLHEAMTNMINAALGVDDANLAWAAAVRAATEAVKENGTTLDITTEKGHANVEALLAMVRAAEQKRQAAINMAGGEDAAASAVAAANAEFGAQIGQLEALMRKLGFTQGEIDGLLGKYRDVANAPNITKYIDIVIRTRGDASALRKSGNVAPGGPNLGYAAGTPKAPAGWAWVGERGPELVNFRGGEQVLDSKSSMRMAATGGYSGGGMAIAVQPAVAAGADSMMATVINKMIRTGMLRWVVVNNQVKPA